MTSKCRKNKEVAHEPQASVSLLFLPHFDVLCDLLLNRPKATWNLFVNYDSKVQGRSQDFSKGGSQSYVKQGHHPGIVDYIWFIPLLSLVYQRAQSHYRGVKAHIN